MSKRLLFVTIVLLGAAVIAACSQSGRSQSGWLPSVKTPGNTTPAARQPRAKLSYQIVSLPSGFTPIAINNRGAVLGYRNGAVIYRHGSMTSLPPLPGDNVATVGGLNDGGIVVGYSANEYNGEPSQPVVWEHGKPHPLRTAEPYSIPFTANYANFINDRGQIVGSVNDHLGYGNYPEFLGTIAFYSRTKLPQPLTGCCGAPTSLNDRGQVTGYGQVSYFPPENLGFLSAGLTGCQSGATAGLQNTNDFALNNKSHFIAQFNGGGPYYVGPVNLFCQGSRVSTLQGAPQGDNDFDYIVGSLGAYGYIRTPQGQYYNLNDLLPSGSPSISQATAINNEGEILASSATRSYVLVPSASCRLLFLHPAGSN